MTDITLENENLLKEPSKKDRSGYALVIILGIMFFSFVMFLVHVKNRPFTYYKRNGEPLTQKEVIKLIIDAEQYKRHFYNNLADANNSRGHVVELQKEIDRLYGIAVKYEKKNERLQRMLKAEKRRVQLLLDSRKL